MKRLILILFVVLIFCPRAEAEAPSDIDIDYKEETGILSVEVTHPSEDPSNHYIEEIRVELPGQEPLTRSFQNQAYESRQVSFWDLELDDVERVEVEATCNQHGELEETFELNAHQPDTDLFTLAQVNSILIQDESVPSARRFEDQLLESVYWSMKGPSVTDDRKAEHPRFGYDKELYGFREDDEYGATEDGRFGYEIKSY